MLPSVIVFVSLSPYACAMFLQPPGDLLLTGFLCEILSSYVGLSLCCQYAAYLVLRRNLIISPITGKQIIKQEIRTGTWTWMLKVTYTSPIAKVY